MVFVWEVLFTYAMNRHSARSVECFDLACVSSQHNTKTQRLFAGIANEAHEIVLQPDHLDSDLVSVLLRRSKRSEGE